MTNQLGRGVQVDGRCAGAGEVFAESSRGEVDLFQDGEGAAEVSGDELGGEGIPPVATDDLVPFRQQIGELG